jgi:APA family basic amino acid/polyamine antiporter
VIFGSWIFYGLVTVSIFVFRRKYPDAERPYRAFGYPIVPVLFLLVAAWLIYITFSNDLGQARESYKFLTQGQPVQALQAIGKTSSFAGSLLILLGLPVYYYFTKRKDPGPDREGDKVNVS